MSNRGVFVKELTSVHRSGARLRPSDPSARRGIAYGDRPEQQRECVRRGTRAIIAGIVLDLVPDYREHRPAVLGTLARRCAWLDPGDREALFHDAYAVMLEKMHDGQFRPGAPEQVRAYLIQTALYKAHDESKRAGRRRSVPLHEEALAQPAADRLPDEVAAAGFDGARVREIVAELPARRQAIVKLRFFFDRTPAEIQRVLGISERIYRKELERSLKQIAAAYRLERDGRFCEGRRSLILAYVAGIAGPNRVADARRHLAGCPGCARWATDLRERAREVAALTPPVPLGGHAAHLPVGDWLAAGRDALGRAIDHARAQVTSWATSADSATSQYLAGARPGTVTAVVVGCLAVGGGATYCASSGILDRHDERRRAATLDEQRRAKPPAPAPQVRRPMSAGARATQRNASPQRRRPAAHRRTRLPATIAKSVATAPPHDEFGIERQPAQAGAAQAAPAAPPGEFDP